MPRLCLSFVSRLWLLIALPLLLAAGCDVIKGPTRETPNTGNPPDTTAAVQKVLVEDYTGYLCGNCPAAADVLKQIIDLYPGRVVAVAVHSGYFATPNTAHPLDFRTPVGDEFNTFFGVSRAGNPNGMVNRTEWDGQRIVSPNAWTAAVASYLEQQPVAKLKIKPAYQAASRQLTVAVDVTYLQTGSADHRLVVLLTENNIIGYQKDYRLSPADVEEYEHNHVLRAALSPTWGEALSGSAPAAGQTISKSFNLTLPADYVAENCHVVAYLAHDGTRQVLQAEEAPLSAQ